MSTYVKPFGWCPAPRGLEEHRPSPEMVMRVQDIASHRVGLKRQLRRAGLMLPWDTPTETLERLCAMQPTADGG